jgi:hypothetical protein
MDSSGRADRVFMFPDPDSYPSLVATPACRILISPSIRFNFGSPKRCVDRRNGPMYFATVPKTSVYEDGYLLRRKDDVG